MRDKTIYFFLLSISLLNVPYTLAQSNKAINIAVIADKAFDLDQSHLVSILEVELSQTEGIKVLERTQIDKILQEQQLSLAGLLDRNTIVKAGKLLRADAFILLSHESSSVEARPSRRQPVDDFNLYCGPLWQWIDGEGDATGINGTLIGKEGEGDITQDSSFGGFIGFHKNIDSDTTVNFEWNATGSSNAFAFSIAKKF